MRFRKFHALGNDYLVLEGPIGVPASALLRRLCDRHRGVGADGVLIETFAGPDADAGVRVFNPDGSEAETSGNGLRIFARYLHDRGRAGGADLRLRTRAGVATCQVLEGGRRVRVSMGRARFGSGSAVVEGPPGAGVALPLGEGYPEGWCYVAVSLGNPHAVVPVVGPTPDLARRWGPTVERDPRFPDRTNVQFVEATSSTRLRMTVWERGAGYTEASGSSACAAAAAMRRLGRCGSEVVVSMPGGDLAVRVDDDFAVVQTGPVVAVADGVVAAELIADSDGGAPAGP